MRKISLLYCPVLSCVIFALLLSGCLSVSSSPASRFYLLRSAEKDRITPKFDITPNTIIGVGPVKIPEYLDRPQIVTQDENNMLTFAQFDRWGEPLDAALARLINENLTAMLPVTTIEMFPWNILIPVRYRLITDVIQLKSELDKDLFFVVQWSVIDLEKKNVVFTKRSQFREPVIPHNYAGLTDALSAVCTSLSSEIAEAVAKVATQPETKGQDKTLP